MGTTKPLSEVPSETRERWRKLSAKKAVKRKVRSAGAATSKIPSLHLLREETDRLRSAEDPEERREIQERIEGLHEQVMEEARDMREQAMRRAEGVRRHMMAPMLPWAQKVYECPRCHRTWTQDQLSYSGRGKRKKPWCPFCNLEIFPEGDERLKHTIFPLKDKYPENITVQE